MIAAGSMFSCAVTEDGALYTWGCNSEGQLGHGDCKDRFIPTKVKMLESEPVFDVACGDEFMCVMAGNNGNIYTWGSNSCGQLGHGDMDVRLVPTKVQHINPVRSIAAGAAHMCALVLGENGGEVLHTWGGGSKGQLGHGTFNNVLLPKLVNCDNLVENTYTVINACLPLKKEKSVLLEFNLDLKGIACSRGSACQSGSSKGSHVLLKLLNNDDIKKPSIRFSLSKYNTISEVDYVVKSLKEFIESN